MSKPGSIINKIVYIVASMIAVFVVIKNLSYLVSPIWILFGVIALLIIAYFLTKAPGKDIYYILGICVLAFILRSIYILLVKTEPSSDFATIYNGALAFTKGDRSPLEQGQFLYSFGYYIPFMMYEALFIKIFGAGAVMALKVMNVLFMTGTVVVVYQITCGIVGAKPARAASFLYAVYPGAIMLSSVLTSQHQSTFFFYLTIFMLLVWKPSRSYLRFVFAGLSLAFSHFFRPESILLIAAVIFCAIVFCIQNISRERMIQVLKGVGITLGVYALLYILCTGAVMFFGLNDGGISNHIPETRFLMGLDSESGGYWSDRWSYIGEMEKGPDRKAAYHEALSMEIEQGPGLISFFFAKAGNYWSQYEDPYWSLGYVADSEDFYGIAMTLLSFDRMVFLAIWLLTSWYLVQKTGRKEEIPIAALFLSSLLCANFVVYLLTEIQPRYRYNIMPAVVILASMVYIEKQEQRKGKKVRRKV